MENVQHKRNQNNEIGFEFFIENNEEKWISGNATYRIDKYMIEGSGMYQIRKEDPKPFHYMLSGQELNDYIDYGAGMAYSWKFTAGSDVFDGKLKLADKYFDLSTAFCEQKSPCMRVEASSKTLRIDGNGYITETDAMLDLQNGINKIGFKNEINRRQDTFLLSGQFFFDERYKYQYNAYNNDSEFGGLLTTPWRTIALEGIVNSPRQEKTIAQIDLYLNKYNKPLEKSTFVGNYDCPKGKNVGKCNVELRYTNPKVDKDFAVVYTADYNYPRLKAEYNLVLDIFTNPNSKIVAKGKVSTQEVAWQGGSTHVSHEVKSQGLNIDMVYEENLYYKLHELKYDWLLKHHVGTTACDNAIGFHVEPKQALLLLKVFNEKLVNVDAKLGRNGDDMAMDAEIKVIGVPTSIVNVTVSKHAVICSISHLDNPSERFEIQAHLIKQMVFDFSVSYYEKLGTSKQLASYFRTYRRDDDVYHITYNKENIKRIVIEPIKIHYAHFKRDLEHFKETAEEILSDQREQLVEIIEWNIRELSPLFEYYGEELEKIDKELSEDHAFQFVFRYTLYFIQIAVICVEEIIGYIVINTVDFIAEIVAPYDKLLRIIEKKVIPRLMEDVYKVLADIYEIVEDSFYQILNKTWHQISEFVGKYEEELKKIVFFLIYPLEVAWRVGFAFYQSIDELIDEVHKRYENIKATYEEFELKLTEALGDIAVPEFFIKYFKEAVTTLKNSTKSPVVKTFINGFSNIIEQKLRQQSTNDDTDDANIIRTAFDILDTAYESYNYKNDPSELSWDEIYPVLAPFLIPNDIFDLSRLEEDLKYVSLSVYNWSQPENLNALVVQGQHVFTFDEKYFRFPGSCNYLLARDVINGNFSIVGSYSNGLLQSLTFADKYDTVTFRKGGHVLLNEAPTELPVFIKHQLEVYRDYEVVSLRSKTGVLIVCDPDLLVCGFRISGYYGAQLRGLLGNGNNEPYDDYTLPSGTIAINEEEFGNSYKMDKQCASVETIDYHGRNRNPSCTRLFSADSSLSACFDVVDPKNYRTACDRGMSAGVPDTDRAIAVAYVAKCGVHNVTVYTPKHYLKCENYEKPVRVGEQFTVKTPSKAADIIIIVDQDKDNEAIFNELIQSLTAELTNKLSAKGISDVDFHLIGYGGEYKKRPAHYTRDGKLIFKSGDSPQLQFSDPLQEGNKETFMEYLERIRTPALVTDPGILVKAYLEGLNYPFRSHAVKSIIVIDNKLCNEAQLKSIQALNAFSTQDKQLTVNLFTTLKKHRTFNNVIGFNKIDTFTFSNSQDTNQFDELKFDNVCVKFALKNRGNVYVVNNFNQDKTQFVKVASQSIVEELTYSKQSLNCKCVMVSPYTARNVCKLTYWEG